MCRRKTLILTTRVCVWEGEGAYREEARIDEARREEARRARREEARRENARRDEAKEEARRDAVVRNERYRVEAESDYSVYWADEWDGRRAGRRATRGPYLVICICWSVFQFLVSFWAAMDGSGIRCYRFCYCQYCSTESLGGIYCRKKVEFEINEILP